MKSRRLRLILSQNNSVFLIKGEESFWRLWHSFTGLSPRLPKSGLLLLSPQAALPVLRERDFSSDPSSLETLNAFAFLKTKVAQFLQGSTRQDGLRRWSLQESDLHLQSIRIRKDNRRGESSLAAKSRCLVCLMGQWDVVLVLLLKMVRLSGMFAWYTGCISGSWENCLQEASNSTETLLILGSQSCSEEIS